MGRSVQQEVQGQLAVRLDVAGVLLFAVAVILRHVLLGRRLELALAAAAGKTEARDQRQSESEAERITSHSKLQCLTLCSMKFDVCCKATRPGAQGASP